MSDRNNSKVTTIEESELRVIHIISRMQPTQFFRQISALLLAKINLKYKDQHIGRFYFKKYLNIDVGKYTYGYIQFMHLDIERLASIGSFCSIADGVIISNGNHPIDRLTTHPFTSEKEYGFINHNTPTEWLHSKNGKITIGNDVWIGLNAIILTSVSIGDGAVIGAGSVVTHSVPPYAIVAGNPAKLIRYRFNIDTINLILKTKWWERNDKEIKKIITELSYTKNTMLSSNHEKEIISCLSKLN
jgi:acetyltransferase-like isoleucine patch superfamily enzyme